MNSDLQPVYDEQGKLLRFTPKPGFAWIPFRRSYRSFALFSAEITRDAMRYAVWFAQKVDQARKAQQQQETSQA